MLNPIILTDSELSEVIERVAPNGREYGAARICRLLAKHEGVLTAKINFLCSVGNISDIVSKSINPVITDMGLYVACTKPPYRILNKFNQPSGQMIWGFYKDAANDPVFNLEPDLVELQDEYPDLTDPDGSKPDTWKQEGGTK